MKRLLIILGYALFMIGSGLLIWTMITEGRVERVFIIDPKFSLLSEKVECDEVQNLLDSEFIVNHPKAIRYGESGEVQVDIENAEIDKKSINNGNELEACGISLEVWFEGDGMIVEPGNKIIKPYLKVPSQIIKLEIFPINDRVIKGTIWISVVFPGDTGSVLERIPIFSVPYTIQVHSLLGLPVSGMRILSFFLIILSLVLDKLIEDPGRKRK